MVFSDTSGKQGLLEDIDFICGTDSTGYATADKVRNCNRHYYVAVSDILKATGRVQFDDLNLTTIPAQVFTLVAGQSQYTLPTDLLQVSAIEIQDNGGNWIRLKEYDKQDNEKTITDYQKTDGVPREYDIIGDQIYLKPAPATGSVTLVGGGKVHYTREVDVFTVNDTTQEPGFAEPFHRIISLGAACDWLIVNATREKHDMIYAQYLSLRAELRNFYGVKNQDIRVGFRPRHNTREYL